MSKYCVIVDDLENGFVQDLCVLATDEDNNYRYYTEDIVLCVQVAEKLRKQFAHTETKYAVKRLIFEEV